MFHPFAELTNRTPSPSQQDENGRAVARKHSPWTAARQKKKTRSFHSSLLDETVASQVPVDSPDAARTTAGCSSDIEAEFSLADGLSPATSHSSVSPHSSPPLNRGEDADVHPAKAYIVDQQITSPDLLSRFTSVANPGAVRSPMWFGSTALQDELADAAGDDRSRHSELQHSSSAPSNVLFHQFDAADSCHQPQQQQQQQQNECSQVAQAQPQASQGQLQHTAGLAVRQAAAAAAAAALPGRRRGLVARRRSWTGAETQRPPATSAASSLGISRLAASNCAGGSSSNDLIAGITGSRAAAAAHDDTSSVADGFELRSRLGATDRQSLYDDVQRLPWEDLDDHAQQQQRPGDFDSRRLGLEQLSSEAVNAVAWYEEKLQEAAEDGDMTAAQQLWQCMQASGITPSRKVVHNYLMCCYYGGCDPIEAEEALRQMCLAADIEPDALTARLLASIDISWQQLHCK